MPVSYIYNFQGVLTGVYDGDGIPENSTTHPPVYVDGQLPQFVNGAWVSQRSASVIPGDQFQLLFTAGEVSAVRRLIAEDPDSALAIWWDRLSNSQNALDLSLASVQEGLAHLVTVGILNDERRLQVLAGIAQ